MFDLSPLYYIGFVNLPLNRHETMINIAYQHHENQLLYTDLLIIVFQKKPNSVDNFILMNKKKRIKYIGIIVY